MSALGEAFLLFEQASEEPDPRVARNLFAQVLAVQRTLGGTLELDERELVLGMTLDNIATLSHALEDWPAMRDAAAEASVISPGDASAHTMHSIALKHLGDREGARAALDRALAAAPEAVGPLHELATQRLAADDRAGALDAIARAMTNGADRADLIEDRELSALHGDARFEELISRENQVAALVALFEREHADLAASAPAPDSEDYDAWLDDDETLDALDEGIELAERILEAAELDEVPSLPPGPDGTEVIDLTACDPTQVRAIEALVAAEAFWPALPFQLVLAQYRLPALSPADARERLGL